MSPNLPNIRLFGLKLPLASIPVIGLPFSLQSASSKHKRTNLCLENGFHLILEDGRNLLIEKNGTAEYDVPPSAPVGNFILFENFDGIALEQGGVLKQENNN